MKPRIFTTEHSVPSEFPGLSVRLRNKRTAQAGRTLLCVHGATYPATVTFDYPVGGQSWMDHLAACGFDVWCIDLLGYGGSDRPLQMAQPAGRHGPVVDTADAVADVKRAVGYILTLRGSVRLDLIGYSWGTAICGQVAGELREAVGRLVLAGALWVNAGTVQIPLDEPLGAYRRVDAAATVRRWTVGLDAAQQAAIAPAERLHAWAQAAVASDPDSVRREPPSLRAPSGVVKDLRDYWLKGIATYDPTLIQCPVLVVVGEWDQETTPEQGLGVFARLSGAAWRRFVMIGAATHLMLLENQRGQLYEVVQAFLSEAPD